jgi:uncharacterized membrane protein
MNAENPAVQPRLRDRLPLVPRLEAGFRWRGTHVTRMESFTDAVFGFAVTLLVVALEVPRSFDGLLNVMRGFPAFVICFAVLMLFWNAHYRYHRRYGLDDLYSRIITMGILVLVLFFVYPLKFLFTLLTSMTLGLDLQGAARLESRAQVDVLYYIYGLGLAGIWTLFALLDVHAWRRRDALKLDASERLHTRATLIEHCVQVSICLLSVALALFTTSTSLPGFVYFLIGPVLALNGWWHGTRIKAVGGN